MLINSQGKITIPKAFREKYGLLPGTEVHIKLSRGRVTIAPILSARSGKVAKKLPISA